MPGARVIGMRIGVVGSMQFTEKLIEVRDSLRKLGHDAFVTDLHGEFVGKNDAQKEVIKIRQKMEQDAMREFWEAMQGVDALLVVNLDKHGIKNYIGGNSFLEMGWAYVLKQKIFLWNPIPDIALYKSEIEAMRPIVVNGDLGLIK